MHYEPPNAPAEAHLEFLAGAGLSRGVLVQPGAYGDDPSPIVGALAQGQGRLRGILAAFPDVTDAALDEWHGAGVRGLRFNDMRVPGTTERFAGAIGTDALASLAPRMASRGWHAEVWATPERHLELMPVYQDLRIPVCLDHMGGLKGSRDASDAVVQVFREALQEGWLWIKLVACRSSDLFPDYPDLAQLHRSLVSANPDRLVWGSDWPHLRLHDRTPSAGHLLQLLEHWIPDAPTRARILVDNPMKLYGF